MKKQDEVLDVLRVPSLRSRKKAAIRRCAIVGKVLCKAFSDAAFSMKEFEQQLNRMRKIIPKFMARPDNKQPERISKG